MIRTYAAAVIVTLLAAAGTADAATVPDAYGFGQIDTNQTSFTEPLPFALSSLTGSVSADTGIPRVSATSSGSNVSGQEVYFFQINSPMPILNIPATISGNVSAFLQTDNLRPGQASSSILLATGGSTFFDENACSGPCFDLRPDITGVSPSHSFTDPLNLSSNTLYAVVLGADAEADPNSIALAMADPSIQIDPSFLKANPGVSLQFSAGIDNAEVAAAPLPAALPLFGSALAGLGGFGWIKRKRKGKVSA